MQTTHYLVLIAALLVPLVLAGPHVGSAVPVYRYKGVQVSDSGRVVEGELKLDKAVSFFQKPKENLGIVVDQETNSRLRVKIFDRHDSRWEVPDVKVGQRSASVDKPLLSGVIVDESATGFHLKVLRDDGSTIFDNLQSGHNSGGSKFNFLPLIFENQYLAISTVLPSGDEAGIYGLGERQTSFRLSREQGYTIFNKDPGGIREMKNAYGSHPFYMCLLNDGTAYGVFLLNSNAIQADLGSDRLVIQTIGGILDLYFFAGPDPEAVVQQYHELIGRPYMPPAWALGLQQMRWGYKKLSTVKAIVDKYRKSQIPIDGIWTDIDMMDSNKDFTINSKNWPKEDLISFGRHIHEDLGMRMVTILDPTVRMEKGYVGWDKMKEMDVWIRDKNGKPESSKLWSVTESAIFDPTHPNATAYWTYMSEYLRDQGFDLDGFKIDQNEVGTDWPVVDIGRYDGSEFDANHPPFAPGGTSLGIRTLHLDSKQYGGLQYNLHNMYGFYEAMVTKSTLLNLKSKERHFLLCRATFPGSGRFGAHWLGDNWSTWHSMRSSIAGVLAMNMFGIPHVGADTLGFLGWPSRELATRWIQIGSFYPFMRSQAHPLSSSHELYAFGDDVTKAAQKAVRTRYSLIPYLYSLLARVNMSGGTVVRPLFFEFAHLPETHQLEWQYMWGRALMICPATEKGQRSVSVLFPKDSRWFDFATGKEIDGLSSNASTTLEVPAPLDHIPTFLRGGYVLPSRNPKSTVLKTMESPLELTFSPDTHGCATGEVFLDDYVSIESASCLLHVEMRGHNVITISPDYSVQESSIRGVRDQGSPCGTLGVIRVLAVSERPVDVLINGQRMTSGLVEYDGNTKVFSIRDLTFTIAQPIEVRF